jgi:dTDP-4-dehydrorhamnose reductase
VTAAPAGRALITGAGGQVGLALLAAAPERWSVVPCGTAELDVTNAEQARVVLERERPTVVIHAAAFTAVEAAESAADRAELVNVRGTAHVAQAARAVGARVIYLSTDFVFDGASGHPYAPDDPPNPLSVYARTKLAGEREVQQRLGRDALVIRTAWVYSAHRRNFVQTMLRLMREAPEVAVVADQVGTPTWAHSLALALWSACAQPALQGVLHWTDAGVASWYDFAVAIQEEALEAGLLDRAVPIRPLRSDEYGSRVHRPPYSVLDKSSSWRVLDAPIWHWRQALRTMLSRASRASEHA